MLLFAQLFVACCTRPARICVAFHKYVSAGESNRRHAPEDFRQPRFGKIWQGFISSTAAANSIFIHAQLKPKTCFLLLFYSLIWSSASSHPPASSPHHQRIVKGSTCFLRDTSRQRFACFQTETHSQASAIYLHLFTYLHIWTYRHSWLPNVHSDWSVPPREHHISPIMLDLNAVSQQMLVRFSFAPPENHC